MKEDKKNFIDETVSPKMGIPKDITDLINKYGTFEVQDTSDTENEYPKISQGIPKKKHKK